ncbi:MAG: Fumarate reductase subunit C [Gammaproteobacteria bacterium]|nr:Fumarate reductase subunit C [Gammaproteobacteria bacterium]
MSARDPYVRPMTSWWLKNPFYVRYMIREATSVFVVLYAFVLLGGLASLVKGETAYNAWLASLANPLAIFFHLMATAAALYHTVTWFRVSPKVTPLLFVGGYRVPDGLITGVQYVIAAVLYLIIFTVAWT